MSAHAEPAPLGPLDLLVIQPTPFCNLDCRYCYLPDRQNTKRISASTLDRLFARVFESELVRNGFTVVWHAGEPLVLRPAFYREAFAIASRHRRAEVAISHAVQTNATLIDQEWCEFIKRHAVRVGVSVDGPEFLNDRHRTTRRGGGTYRRVVQGMAALRRNAIPFHVITVLTRDSLDYPDELYAFYVEHGIDQIGFNVEEIEGPHQCSSLASDGSEVRYREFLSRFYDLAGRPGSGLRVREFDSALAAIVAAEREPPRLQETAPFAIVSVDCDGNFSSFSPELLGLPSSEYGDFALGNVHATSFAAAARSPRFAAMEAAIAAGVARCRQNCTYFRLCGGGAPANKYFENGSFDSAETLFCRLTRQAVLDVVLDKVQGAAVNTVAGQGSAPSDSSDRDGLANRTRAEPRLPS
jgi:uncharacterized protein